MGLPTPCPQRLLDERDRRHGQGVDNPANGVLALLGVPEGGSHEAGARRVFAGVRYLLRRDGRTVAQPRPLVCVTAVLASQSGCISLTRWPSVLLAGAQPR